MNSCIKEKTKYLIVALLIGACLALIHYFQAASEAGGFFTHFFHVPIVLSAFWWKRKGLIVPVLLGLYLVLSRYCCLGSDDVSLNRYFEIVMFVITALLVTFLSERIQKTEEKLHQSDARYRSMFENMSEGVVVYKATEDGTDFVFVDMNAAAENIDDLRRECVIGKRLLEVLASGKESKLHEILKRVSASGKSEGCAECFYRGERVSSWRQCSIYPLPTGEIVSLYCDRTEQKKAEERILQLASIVESADDAIVSMNLAGVIQSWNPGAKRMYGYSTEEMSGQPILALVAAHRIEEVKANLEQIKKGERLDNYETVHLHKDDRRLEVSLTLSPLKDLGGNVIGASMIARNIMRRKKAEKALQKAYEQLELKVEERTRELKTANEELRKEIVERERIEEALTESSEKIKAFAYVINIPRYVDTFEGEEEIDIMAVQNEINQIEAELAQVRVRMEEYMKELYDVA